MEFFREPTRGDTMRFIPLVERRATAKNALALRIRNLGKIICNEGKRPFCERCAKIDFKEKVDHQIREQERSVGYMKPETFKMEIPSEKELEDIYANPKNFEKIGEQKAMEPTGTYVYGGVVRRNLESGKHVEYRCKKRGCKISIFIEKKDAIGEIREPPFKMGNVEDEKAEKKKQDKTVPKMSDSVKIAKGNR